MRTLALASGLVVAVASPAAADIGNGPVSVTLAPCEQAQTDSYLPGCSFITLVGKDAPSYIYTTSSWTGTTSSGLLSFPATDQNWPSVTGERSITWTPKDIAGTVGDSGRLRLAMQYEMSVEIPEGVAAGTCTLSGVVELTSEGTEYRSGQAVGQDVDPATGRFAVVSTSAYPLVPQINATCLRVAAVDYDLLKGASWYLTGTMTLPHQPAVSPARAQTAKVKLPKRIKAKGKTVLLQKTVRTNAGQKLVPTVTWSGGSPKKYASVKTTTSGKVTIRTTGKARRLRVSVTLRAKATDTYLPYARTTTWLVKR